MKRAAFVLVLVPALVLAGCLMVPFDTELSVGADFASRLDLLHHVERDRDFEEGTIRFIPLPYNPEVGYIVGLSRYSRSLYVVPQIGAGADTEEQHVPAPVEGGVFTYDAWILPRFGSTTQLTLFMARRTETGLDFTLFDKAWFDRDDWGPWEYFINFRLEQAIGAAVGSNLTIEAVNVAYALVDGNDGPEIGTQLQILARDSAYNWREYFIPWDAGTAVSVALALDRSESVPLAPELVTIGTTALSFPTTDIAYVHNPVSNQSYVAYRDGMHQNAPWVTQTWNSTLTESPVDLVGGYKGPIAWIDPAGNLYSSRSGRQTVVSPEGRVIETRDANTVSIESVQLRGEGIRPLYSAVWQYTNRNFVAGVYGGSRTEPQLLADANYAPATVAGLRRGPAGGWEFPVVIGGQTWYYEVAPVSTERERVGWSGDYRASFIGTSVELGTGQSNTDLIVLQHGRPGQQFPDYYDEVTDTWSYVEIREYAAWLCDSLTAGGFSDWFLPSRDELSELQKLFDAGVGDLTSGMYWSSSEPSEEWLRDYRATTYDFRTRSAGESDKWAWDEWSGHRVRAVRRYIVD